MYLLGYDIGSSSVKAALVDARTLATVGSVHYPEKEMDIIARQTGWAEQQPEVWWENLIAATQKLFAQFPIDRQEVQSIGISYQMHGLVLLDKEQHVLRPSIIWCDSRAVGIGEKAFEYLGEEFCLSHLLNSPGNFTASKLKWVKDHEPELYDQIDKVLLPGDYINLKLTGEVNTTVPALSEGVFWDFQENQVSTGLMAHFGFCHSLIPDIVDTFSIHGQLTSIAARSLGLKKGTPVSYRAGDQPNNALSLGVLNPGEIAATGGTSGVVYGVGDQPLYDPQSRINGFAHVNHSPENPRIGMLLCINGAGIQYSWMKKMLATEDTSYYDIERMLSSIPVNSDGLCILPFGNGAERMLNNRDIGSRVLNLNFNRHSKAHMYRASLEGISYSFVYGIEIMKEVGIPVSSIRVGNDNLFQSEVFSSTIATLLDCEIEMLETTGAVGAAKASAVGTQEANSLEEVLGQPELIRTYTAHSERTTYETGYHLWKAELLKLLNWKKKHQVNDHEHSYWRETIL